VEIIMWCEDMDAWMLLFLFPSSLSAPGRFDVITKDPLNMLGTLPCEIGDDGVMCLWGDID